MCESFPAFPSASQLYTIKSNSSLSFALKLKAMSVSPHPPWASTFSFLLSCLRTGATLTQHVLSHKHQSSGVSCILGLPTAALTLHMKTLKIKGTFHWRLLICYWTNANTGRTCKLHRDQMVDTDSDLLAVNNATLCCPVNQVLWTNTMKCIC